mmetsp:Transcript_42246/g.48602  ORF Transcript_42246/g.48602 Transcript_42246/m.48602 type:complete len:84 (+) Transcript_42246:1-252(+)
MYEYYSTVDEKFLKLREIVVANKLPRKLELNNHLYKDGETFGLKSFEKGFSGIIESFSARYGTQVDYVAALWEQYADLIKYNP